MTTPTPPPLDAVTLAARVAELERELAAQIRASNASLVEMASHANALRDALEELRGVCVENPGVCSLKYPTHRCAACQDNAIIDTALAQTPAASLAAHDAEVLERAGAMLAQLVAQGNAGNLNAFGDGLVQGHKNALEVVRALAAQAQEVKP